jgi:hypothetical protein
MLTFQMDKFFDAVSMHENADMAERIGFVEGLDLITMREELRKHGVET